MQRGFTQVARRLTWYARKAYLPLTVITPDPSAYPDERYLAVLSWSGEPYASLGRTEAAGERELSRLSVLYADAFQLQAVAAIGALRLVGLIGGRR